MGFLDPFGDADGVFEKPLALASLWEEFALTRATLSRFQADPVLLRIQLESGSPSDLVKPVCLFKKVMEEPFRLCAPP